MAETRAAGAIYDLGYQRYSGQRLGRGYAVWRLITYSYRQAFAFGRPLRARIAPMIVFAVTLFPAIAQVAAANFTGQATIINYGLYLSFTTGFLAMFAAAQAPELVVGDRQHGVLALYLSRPLRGTDYAWAKLAAMMLAMLTLTLTPQILLFISKIFLAIDPPWTAFKAEAPKLFAIIGGTIGTSLYMASIGLAISSLAARRAFANAGVIAYFLLMPAATVIFNNLATGDAKRYSVLANPAWLVVGFTNWLFDIEARRRSVVGRADLPGTAYLLAILGISAVFITVLMLRYRKSET
jgi:ABC-2 type transport system permease protein